MNFSDRLLKCSSFLKKMFVRKNNAELNNELRIENLTSENLSMLLDLHSCTDACAYTVMKIEMPWERLLGKRWDLPDKAILTSSFDRNKKSVRETTPLGYRVEIFLWKKYIRNLLLWIGANIRRKNAARNTHRISIDHES
jgi:hypothetical protein